MFVNAVSSGSRFLLKSHECPTIPTGIKIKKRQGQISAFLILIPKEPGMWEKKAASSLPGPLLSPQNK